MAIPSPAITCTVGGAVVFKNVISNVGTIETTTAHGLAVGDIVTLAGVDGTFNGSRTVTVVPSTKRISFALVTADVTEVAATGTVEPTTVALTEARPSVAMTGVETVSHSPAATARAWRVGGVAVPNATLATEDLVVRRAGAPVAVTCFVTNADGSAASAAKNVTVTDAVATTYVPVALDGTTRVPPLSLPWEYRDPTVATPGLPTANELASAKAIGTILPTASQNLAVSSAA